MRADAGLGKTALAASLAHSRGWPCHFTRGRNGSVGSTALSNLSAQLIARYELGDQFAPQRILPETAGEPGWFEQVLRAAAGVARADGGRVVLVVDGLDEAEVFKGALPLGLPVVLPHSAFIVATCRTGTNLPALRQPFEMLEIRPRSRHNISDLEHFLRTVFTEDEELAALLSAGGVTADAATARLLNKCGGVWIYLRYVLNELQLGKRSVENLDTLPSDLSAYYAESLLAEQDNPDWGHTTLPLLATLAAAAEPLPVPTLTRLAGLPDQHPVQTLCADRLRPFLAVTSGETDGLLRYSVYHASLREFLAGSGPTTHPGGGQEQAEELARAAADAHSRIADHYLSAFGGLNQRLPAVAADPSIAQLDDGYALRHLAEHLDRAGRAGDLDILLACEQSAPARGSVWFAAHERAGTLSEYRADIDRARRHAAACTDQDMRLAREAPSLLLELRYLMLDSTVRTLTTSVPSKLIGRLVQSGLWNPARALFYARQPGDLTDRALALATLVAYLPEGNRPAVTREAIAVAGQVAAAYPRAWAFTALLEELPGTPPDEIAVNALTATAEIAEDAGSAQMLSRLAEKLPSSLLPQAASIGIAISDESQRERALTALIPHLPETALPGILAAVPRFTDSYTRSQIIVALASRAPAVMLAELADAARTVPANEDRAWALGMVASCMPEPSLDLANEALTAARATTDPTYRAWALSSLAGLFNSEERKELLNEALSAARAADEVEDRVWALTTIAPELASADRRSVLSEALREALACPPGPEQSDCLDDLSSHLTKAQLARAVQAVLAIQSEDEQARLLASYAPVLPDQFFEPALRSAAEIHEEWLRGNVMQALAPHLPEHLLADALSAAGSISGAYERSSVIGALADRLPDRLLSQALSLVQSMTNESGSAQFLCGIAARTEEPRRTQLLQEALTTARSVTNGRERAQSLGDIAASLNGAEREQVLTDAIQAAKADPYEFRRVYALYYLIPRLTSAQRKLVIADALTITRALSDAVDRAGWLAALARYVPRSQRPALLTEALEAAHTLTSEQQRLLALLDVAVSFPGDERIDVFKEFLALADSATERLPLWGRPVVKIARILPDRLILKTLELIRQARCENNQLATSGRILRGVPNRLIEGILDIVRNNPFGLDDAHALGTAALYLPVRLRQEALSLALDVQESTVARRAIMTQARSLWREGMTTTELDIFRQTITGTGLDEYLTVLTPALDIIAAAAGTQALDDCLQTFRTIQRWWLPPEAGTAPG